MNPDKKNRLTDATDGNNQAAIEVFFDGACPLCRREIAMLQSLDRNQRIRFSDISSVDFDATRLGMTRAGMMAEIHGRLPDGSWVVGVEVFRRLYAAIGLRTLAVVSRWPVVSHVLELGYRVFAPLRLRFRPKCRIDDSCRIPTKRADIENHVSSSDRALARAGASG